METQHLDDLCELVLDPLKPSLVEWKLLSPPSHPAKGPPLKPSLVEWKQKSRYCCVKHVPALKPSLVEWKQTGDLLPVLSAQLP